MEAVLINNQSELNICKIFNIISTSKASVEHCSEFDLYIARTGIYITPQRENVRKFFVGGFSCKSDKQYAIQVAQYEAAERVLATYEMSDKRRRDIGYLGYYINGETFSDMVDPKELLLYLGEKNAPENDAVGLSFHSDLEMAIFHAVSEFLERWLLARIWYENMPIILMKRIKLGGNYIAEHYTISSKYAVPFVMTIMFNEEMTFLTLGASLSQNFSIAQSKSLSEACMLSYDIISKKNYDMISNKDSIVRMQSQSDPNLSKSRYNHIQSILCADHINSDVDLDCSFNLENILDGLELKPDSLQYCILHQSQKYFLVRAFSCELLSLRRYREIYRNEKSFLLDPVC